MKRNKPADKKRNPIAKAVTRLRPQVVPNLRKKKLIKTQKREAEQDIGDGQKSREKIEKMVEGK